jgi:hypothetical protein
MTIKGSDITVGTTLRWFERVGRYYPETVEVTRTVKAILPSPNPNYIGLMTFVGDYQNHTWFIDGNKDYETVSQGRTWLDGDPNNPL